MHRVLRTSQHQHISLTMQGFNMGRYVPPHLEGTTTGNKLHNKHKRPAVVRFEMPFAVWCASCPKPTVIGQGVRFNAEKRRAGAYHSTPVWNFRMRHADCGGALEIQTDPRNTAYVVVRGGTRRDTGEPACDAVPTAEAREALRRNAFANLERTIEDREQLRRAGERIEGLMEASARHWDDPYAQNQRLRRAFRAGRQAREREAAAAADLGDRMSLGIELVPATEDDARRAAQVDFGRGSSDARSRLASELTKTRAATDPFQARPSGKRKRAAEGKPETADSCVAKPETRLVEYDSD
ncbi:Protein saf4 [Tolypocladium ophioglossoides CBS 100239]|uniref:Protein saf4 n=1 Tax=Tolypocladium ophioglossoides (strain CBS 100239) TaxID=1163406 RepID=A0A0L0N205_TOLOC|nr:Protein saf4 [Tolypocladium ophioglossoides CBS 100239]